MQGDCWHPIECAIGFAQLMKQPSNKSVQSSQGVLRVRLHHHQLPTFSSTSPSPVMFGITLCASPLTDSTTPDGAQRV